MIVCVQMDYLICKESSCEKLSNYQSSFCTEVVKMRFFVFFCAIVALFDASSSNESCSVEDAQICGLCTNIGCVDQKYNLIGSFSSVSSVEECHQWCNKRNEYMDDCKYLTYYGKDGRPSKNICYIFSSCEKKIERIGCVTEATDCYKIPTSTATTTLTTLLTTPTMTTTIPTNR